MGIRTCCRIWCRCSLHAEENKEDPSCRQRSCGRLAVLVIGQHDALRTRHGDQECRKHCTCGARKVGLGPGSRSKTRYPARGLPAAPVPSYGTRSWALLNYHVPYTRATSRRGRPGGALKPPRSPLGLRFVRKVC